MDNVLNLLKEVFDGIERTLDADSVIGTPIVNGDSTVVPISRMTVGFASGGGEIEGKNAHRQKDSPLGAIGGGATINPVGFLVLDGFNVRFIKTEGGDKWTDNIENFIDIIAKK